MLGVRCKDGVEFPRWVCKILMTTHQKFLLPLICSPPSLSSTVANSRTIHFSLVDQCHPLLWSFGSSGGSALEFFHLLPQSKMFLVFRVIPVSAPWTVILILPFYTSIVIIIQNSLKAINNKILGLIFTLTVGGAKIMRYGDSRKDKNPPKAAF